jgi:lambda repressor-like predicted transcriptional regulator
MSFTDFEKKAPAAALERSALQAAAPIVLALMECDEDLREEALGLFKQLEEGGLDEEQRFATTALLAEILFPQNDHKGMPGLDLVEAETMAPDADPEAKGVLQRMDREEATFAERLRDAMRERGVTQAQLAEKIGVGQPAISMMLQRECRPQRRTVTRLAEALGVSPDDLWPGFTP